MVSNQCFPIGGMIRSQSGIPLIVNRFIGEGGQGQVYEVESGGKQWALKYYTREEYATSEQMQNLRGLIEIGSPDATFLWPIDLVQKPGHPCFGYIMPLRPPRYSSLIEYVKRKTDPTFYAVITAAYNLAESFSKLHAGGLCYRDISLGNIFLDPDTGDVLICDNDNVCYNNAHTMEKIGGTAGFMAPEIVMGRGVPNRNTDLYSLSVLLFHLLFISHPLDGIRESRTDCWDPEAEKRIHGEEALFIFDPDDAANRPDPSVHRNAILFWNLYPESIKQYFVRAFTTGLFDPENGRVRENEWKSALLRVRDLLFSCPQCSTQVFFDPLVHTGSSVPKPCWRCSRQVAIPPGIRIGTQGFVVLHEKSVLSRYHLYPAGFDPTIPFARVSRHPTLDISGLQNLSQRNWLVTFPDGTTTEVPPQKSIQIKDRVIVDFGGVKGEFFVRDDPG